MKISSRCATLASRSIIESARRFYCTPLAMLATGEIGRARHREASRRLDFLAPHVYPEACQNTPQIDRDAVIVFSVD
ncbi:MAG: hypothetical protein ABSB13_14855 [Candidatus Binatus sp.]|jgi:hypothetical protein|uniref:hypothetical protein n=1 Tax=Candidatus Binatus sp. TaxID=2811406 RepID=UPI003D0D2CD2